MTFTGPHTPAAISKQREAALRRWAQPGEREKQSVRALERGALPRHKRQAKGVRNGCKVGAMVYFDEDTFKRVRALAVKEGKSFTEIVRTFVDWGLDEEGAA